MKRENLMEKREEKYASLWSMGEIEEEKEQYLF